MSYLYLKFAFPIAFLLTVGVLIIHAQSYDDGDLRTLLVAANCEMPCFMGIRPGVTTVDEAVKLLESSQWVEKVVQKNTGVQWYWNTQAPAFLGGFGSPSLSSLKVNDTQTPIVSTIHIPTRLPAGFLYLLQSPVAYQIVPPNRQPDITSAQNAYMSVKFEPFSIRAAVGCSMGLDDFWTRPVELSIDSNAAIYKYWSLWDSQELQTIIARHWHC